MAKLFMENGADTTGIDLTWMESQIDATEKDKKNASYEDIDNLEDEYVAPYLVEQSTVMLNATGPLEWEIGNYRFGVCAQEAIGKMADTVYAETINQACNELYDIQGRYSRNCYIAATCNVSDESKDELRKVIDQLWTAHSTAGYTRPNP